MRSDAPGVDSEAARDADVVVAGARSGAGPESPARAQQVCGRALWAEPRHARRAPARRLRLPRNGLRHRTPPATAPALSWVKRASWASTSPRCLPEHAWLAPHHGLDRIITGCRARVNSLSALGLRAWSARATTRVGAGRAHQLSRAIERLATTRISLSRLSAARASQVQLERLIRICRVPCFPVRWRRSCAFPLTPERLTKPLDARALVQIPLRYVSARHSSLSRAIVRVQAQAPCMGPAKSQNAIPLILTPNRKSMTSPAAGCFQALWRAPAQTSNIGWAD